MILALSAGRTSPADLRGRLALDEAGQRSVLNAPRPGVGELTVLCTCHRTEVYFTADGMEADAVHVVAGLLPGLQPTDHHDLRFLEAIGITRWLLLDEELQETTAEEVREMFTGAPGAPVAR